MSLGKEYDDRAPSEPGFTTVKMQDEAGNIIGEVVFIRYDKRTIKKGSLYDSTWMSRGGDGSVASCDKCGRPY